MSRRLPVPEELQHLIEKREREEERRQKPSRRDQAGDRRTLDLGPIGAIESAQSLDDVPTEERRTASERRERSRRRRRRRHEDR